MSELVAIEPMSIAAIDRVRALEIAQKALPQVDIPTDHLIHAGMYARTILIPAGVSLTGVLVKRATTVILSGEASVYTETGLIHLNGYHVIAASAGRKQAYVAHKDTYLTMIFPSKATAIEQAEDEFTDEPDLLFSRTGVNNVTITGE